MKKKLSAKPRDDDLQGKRKKGAQGRKKRTIKLTVVEGASNSLTL